MTELYERVTDANGDADGIAYTTLLRTPNAWIITRFSVLVTCFARAIKLPCKFDSIPFITLSTSQTPSTPFTNARSRRSWLYDSTNQDWVDITYESRTMAKYKFNDTDGDSRVKCKKGSWKTVNEQTGQRSRSSYCEFECNADH